MRPLRTVFIAAVVLTLGSLATGAEKDKKTQEKVKDQEAVHTVTASMDYPTNGGIGIQAEKRPGEFTIPKGAKGTKLKYQFSNPKTGSTLTRINGRNVYSVTEHRYMNELDGNPDYELPPGEYRFVVGGEPGAIGSLTYTLAQGSANDTPSAIRDKMSGAGIPRNGKISLVLSVPDVPNITFHWDFDIKEGAVVGRGECTGVPTDHIQNYHAEYRLQGTLTGRRITGTASEKITWESKGGFTKTRYDGQGEVELILHNDHTVVGSENHSGTTNGEPSVKGQRRGWVGTWQMSQKRAAKP